MDPPSAPTQSRSHRGRKIVLGALGVVALYGLVVGVLVPPFAKKTIAEKVGEKLGRGVALDDLSINPFTLKATAKGFRVLESDKKTAFASFDQLDINGSITSVYRLA